jgi:phosphonate transport system ATP-binding protein
LHLPHALPDRRRNLAQRYQSGHAFGRAAASGSPAAGNDLAAGQPGSAAQCASGALGRHGGLWTALGGLPAVERRAAKDYLRAVGLVALARQRAGTLSGGQAQRVAIARALAQRPQVLLADEPVASLDPEAADDIMRLLRRLAAHEHLAVLCVLHQIELAYAYADRVVGIRDGTIAFDRPCAELSRDAVRQLYLSEAA